MTWALARSDDALSWIAPSVAPGAMSIVTKREPFFECVFVSDGNEYAFHFRAWSAAEAEHHLKAELRDHGVSVSGELRILDPRGRLVRTGKYRPAGRRPPASAASPRRH